MPLKKISSIPISTKFGTSELELYLGDLTDLSKDDNVDVALLSAFPGNYNSKNKGTLIHALKQKLNIDVEECAENKDVDLRKIFSCWKSTLLPEDKPFRRFICFEMNSENDTDSMEQQIARIFGALMVLLTDSESSIVTPVLGTGMQMQPFFNIFSCMIESGIEWLLAGLPIKHIKIVLYSEGIGKKNEAVYEKQISYFNDIKSIQENVQGLHLILPSLQVQRLETVGGKQYNLTHLLGRGGFSKVFRAEDTMTGEVRAVKIVDLMGYPPAGIADLIKETTILEKLNTCDSVIKMYCWEHDKKEQRLLIVLAYAETDLDNFLNSINHVNPNMAQYLWKQMVISVQAMHDEGVIHADLKPANFVLVKGSVKLCDFGISEAVEGGFSFIITDVVKGTPRYISPEAVTNLSTNSQQSQHKIAKRSDVWSLGCILYQMVYNHSPYPDRKGPAEVLDAIMDTNYKIKFEDIKDKQLLDIMKKCLTRNKDKRPSTQELLKHPYLERTY